MNSSSNQLILRNERGGQMPVNAKLLSAARKVAVWAVSLSSIALVYYLVIHAIEDSPDGITNGWRTTALFLGLVAAIVVHSTFLLLLEPRKRIIGTMALRNLRRRKRNTALIVVGLLVGSAIISSSLVVGDSLDATLNAEFTEALDETDIVIQGTDINGFPVWWNQSSALDFVNDMESDSDIDAVSIGIKTSVSIKVPDRKTVEPHAHWLAMDGELQQTGTWNPLGGSGGVHYSDIETGNVVINEHTAEQLELRVGDRLEVSWTDINAGVVSRPMANFTVQAIVSTTATGFVQGGDTAIFTELAVAQELMHRTEEINRIAMSATGGLLDSYAAEQRVLPRVNSSFDAALLGVDAGLDVATIPEEFSLAVQSTAGDGLLSGAEVESLRENLTFIASDTPVVEMLMAPLAGLSHEGVNLTGLLTAEVNGFVVDDVADWYATPAGLSVQKRESSQWFQWIPPDEMDNAITGMVSVGDGAVLSLHSSGVRLSALDEDVPSRDIDLPESDGEMAALAVTSLSGVPYGIALQVSDDSALLLHGTGFAEEGNISWNGTNLDVSSLPQIESGELAVEGDQLLVRLQASLSSHTCAIPLTILSGQSTSCAWQQDPPAMRHLVQVGDAAWDQGGQDLVRTLSRLSSINASAHDLGLPAGDILSVGGDAVWVDGPGLYIFNGTHFVNATLQPPAAADGNAVWSDDSRTLASGPDGAFIVDENGISGRLPYQHSVDGVSKIPMVALAITGGGTGLPEPSQGEVMLTAWSATGVAITPPANLSLLGLLPAARGYDEPLQLNYSSAVPPLPAPPGQPGLDDLSIGIINVSDAEALLLMEEPVRTSVLIAGPSLALPGAYDSVVENVTAWTDEITTAATMGFRVIPMKSDVRKATEDAGANFSALFLVFGSFVIFAGILLVMNLFVMLADERKSEMGMTRALGMQRGDLRTMFVLEGSVIGLVSSAIGAVLGIGVARLLMVGLDKALSDSFGGSIVFAWEWHSLLTGFSIGFLVTWATLLATSFYISRMNVVAAMRNIPTRLNDSLPWWTIIVSLLLICAAAGCVALAFTIGDPVEGSRLAWWLTAGFLFLLGLVPPLFMALNMVLPESVSFGSVRMSRKVIVPRLVMTTLGLAMFGWGVWTDPWRADMEPGGTSLIVLGLFLVAAGVLLLTSLAPMIARALARAGSSLSGRLASVLPTALAYPLATPFRTAMTMGMFSLVVFAVVILSGYSAMFGNLLGDLSENAKGEWEIVAFGDVDLGDDSSQWDLGDVDPDTFDAIAVIETAVIQTHKLSEQDLENHSQYTSLRGFDANFTAHGALPLDSWSPELGSTPEEVWQRVFENESLVVIDYQLAVEEWQGERGIMFEGMDYNIGDAIVVKDPFNPYVNHTLYVAAVLKEESGWFASGINVNKNFSRDHFDSEPASIWFSLPDGTSLEEEESVAKELQYALVEEGYFVISIESVFQTIQSFIFAMFGLLQAFLALGLAVGIAGLGVITIRNVSERQHQTGILRALGFQRGMVVAGYLIELTWVSLLGILNGAVVGIGFHWQLYVKYLKDEGAEFVMPWGEISLIVFGAYLLTLLATAWPVRKAASIHPAEALRAAE
jgi:putative ABC transport system permease protein